MNGCCTGDCRQGRDCPARKAGRGAPLPMLTERLLDARQMELVIAGRPLPDLLLSTGCMTGPHRKTRPITRWRLAARRFTRALIAFLAAPRPYL